MSEDNDATSMNRRKITVAGRRRSLSSPRDVAGTDASDSLESDFEDMTTTEPPPSEPSAFADSTGDGIDDSEDRATTEHATPSDAPITEEERTEPRIRVAEVAAVAAQRGDRDSDPDERTNPRIYVAGLGLAGLRNHETVSTPSPVVVIAQARIISDTPPAMHVARPAVDRVPPAVDSVVSPAIDSVAPASAEVEDESEIVDVVDGEEDTAPLSTPPPPPPTELRGKAVAKPPPPPGPAAKPEAAKPEEERQKRTQTRQWWERFFSDDYLATVPVLTAAQVARQVDFIESSLALAKGGTVLDVGCGLGAHAIELTRRGYLVVALDLSLAMITRAAETAQQQGLKVNLVHADIREIEFDGAFDAVICMGTTFGFFDDDANRDVLLRLHHALKPGGRLLLDTVNRDYVMRSQPNLVWFEGEQCVCMEESDFNYFNSRLAVKRTMMRDDGRQSQAEYSVRLYSLHELGQLMHQLGFRVLEVSGQEALRGVFFGATSPRMLTVAERRSQGRPSIVMPMERGSGEVGRPGATTGERQSVAIPRTSS